MESKISESITVNNQESLSIERMDASNCFPLNSKSEHNIQISNFEDQQEKKFPIVDESNSKLPDKAKEMLQESPDSPKDEEVLFFEDRNASESFSFNPKSTVFQESEDFIRIGDVENTQHRKSSSAGETSSKLKDETSPMQKITFEGGDLMFMEDRTPRLTGEETQSPRYVINKNFLKIQDPKPKKMKLANSCWNCDETTHSLRDCPHPRDHAKVAGNRREFQSSKPAGPIYRRYHLDEGQRLAHIVPGQLSSTLRRALGLDKRELPGHIYMMRRLGYPPGWLAEACISHSGITMFDGQGKMVAEPESEKGEIQEPGSLDKYDVNKIHHFPGFNVPPPPDTYDDSDYYKVPPISRQQSVEVMLDRLMGRIVGGYKRKKLSLDSYASVDEMSQSSQSQDMDYEVTPEASELPVDNCKFVPPLPEEEDLPPPPPTELPPESSNDSKSTSVTMEDTSLVELEEKKKLLLAQLNNVSSLCSTPKGNIGKIKSLDLGTPILKSVSPYARLPSAEKFSVNICDVINFENLPDSTGKYKKMSGLIHKVRKRLSDINRET